MLDKLNLELRHAVLDQLGGAAGLARLPAVCKFWRALLAQHLSSWLRLSANLRKFICPNGKAALRNLQLPAIVCVGGYDSSWNRHKECEQEYDSPGCLQSSEVVCMLNPRGLPAAWQTLPFSLPRHISALASPTAQVWCRSCKNYEVPRRLGLCSAYATFASPWSPPS